MKKFLILSAMLCMAACSTTTQLPDLRGETVRPLNASRWDYQQALQDKQREIGVRPVVSDSEN